MFVKIKKHPTIFGRVFFYSINLKNQIPKALKVVADNPKPIRLFLHNN